MRAVPCDQDENIHSKFRKREDLKMQQQAWVVNITRTVYLAAGQRREVDNMRKILLSMAYEEVLK
jgi:hypothetical protein